MERLESLIATGRSLPLTRNVIVDRDAALNFIDELRLAVPEEIRAAKRINSEGERILENAQEEAARIIANAQEQAAFLIGERGLTDAAAAESERLILLARDEGAAVRAGADEYAAGVLEGLEAEVAGTLGAIRRGLELLDERRTAYAAAEAATAEDDDPGYALDPDGDEEPESDATGPVRR